MPSRHLRILTSLLILSLAACVTPPEPAKPVRVVLVGDSTMATRTGYGDALCQRFNSNVTCINLARGGRSSGSFRAEGLWDKTLQLLKDSSPYNATYVLIQFGHNDQPGKPGRSTDLATEFPVNIARYVDELRSAGAKPVLVTPLTRRVFRNGVLNNDLEPWAEATRRIAAEKQVPLLDLNAASSAAVSAMGPQEADTFAMAPRPAAGTASSSTETGQDRFDHTHLGPKGAEYFSGMMAGVISQKLSELAKQLKSGTASR